MLISTHTNFSLIPFMKKVNLKKRLSFENVHYNLFSRQDFSSQPIQNSAFRTIVFLSLFKIRIFSTRL